MSPLQLLQPGTQRRMTFCRNLFVTRPHQVFARFMVSGLCVHRSDHGQFIELTGQVGQELADLCPCDRGIDRLGIPLIDVARLQVKGIQMGHGTIHEQIDQPFGFATGCRLGCDDLFESRQHRNPQHRLGGVFDKLTTINRTKLGKQRFHRITLSRGTEIVKSQGPFGRTWQSGQSAPLPSRTANRRGY